MSRIDQYVKSILANVECDDHEREDIIEEITTHLIDAKREYQKKGYSEQEAENMAVNDFGKEEQIGNDLQHSMFPFRKELLLLIGFGSILFSFASYYHNVIMFSDNTYIILTLSVLIASSIVFAAVNPHYFRNRKVLVNILLAVLNPFYFINLLIIDTSEHWYVPILDIFGVVLVICTLVMIILTAIKTPTHKKLTKKMAKRRKIIHVVNLIIGIIVVGFSMLVTFGVLVFAGVTKELLFPAGIVFVWALLYWIQIKVVDRKGGNHETKNI
ncbi:hypothetical protein FZW96_00220 [Bacillus sp. BGMRC 2118]|nr:hypothetical protein FZW96_00220 [Bacillus sp. BGMRC 2118]